MIQLGYNIISKAPIVADLNKTGHICLIGGTGSGKSVSVLYFLYYLLKNYDVKLYICDFKKSGDYKGITESFAEFDEVTRIIEEYHKEYAETPEDNSQLKILLLDEYAGYIIWLMQRDKKKAEEVKAKISEILMLGRSRKCFVWSVQQRIGASLYPSGIGAVDNFQICVGLGKLSVDSRKSLFAGEHLANKAFEERYHPITGQGLILIDGQELQPLQIPYIKDKRKLQQLLQNIVREKVIDS